jgi:hypothetical protein
MNVGALSQWMIRGHPKIEMNCENLCKKHLNDSERVTVSQTALVVAQVNNKPYTFAPDKRYSGPKKSKPQLVNGASRVILSVGKGATSGRRGLAFSLRHITQLYNICLTRVRTLHMYTLCLRIPSS